MLDGQFRNQIETWVKPVGQSVRRAGISADLITAMGLVMAVACSIAIGLGSLRLGLLLLALTGIPDLIDGAVAKAAGGVAWYFTRTTTGALPLLPFAVYVTASLVSYIRAKADALGFDARGGIIERAERFILLGFGLLFDNVLVWVLVALVVLNSITAAQRFVKVWSQASDPIRVSSATPRRRRRVAETSAAERWRSRRLEARARSTERRRPPTR